MTFKERNEGAELVTMTYQDKDTEGGSENPNFYYILGSINLMSDEIKPVIHRFGDYFRTDSTPKE